MQKLLILLLSVLYPCLAIQGQKLVYKDAKQPIEVRVKDLLERMTLHEKILQLNQGEFVYDPLDFDEFMQICRKPVRSPY